MVDKWLDVRTEEEFFKPYGDISVNEKLIILQRLFPYARVNEADPEYITAVYGKGALETFRYEVRCGCLLSFTSSKARAVEIIMKNYFPNFKSSRDLKPLSKDIPVLKGEDAQRFLDRMEEVEKRFYERKSKAENKSNYTSVFTTDQINSYMEAARSVSLFSLDPIAKIGAVIVDSKGKIISKGYNTLPIGVKETEIRYKDRVWKQQFEIHAEMNAISMAARNGEKLLGASIFVHGLPTCNECAKAIIQSGIKEVYMDTDPRSLGALHSTWMDAWEITKTMFDEAGIHYFFTNNKEYK